MKTDQIASLLKALANEQRLEILKVLSQYKFASVGYIAGKINLSFRSTSKHLLLLQQARAISHYREGNFIMYKLRPKMNTLIRSVIQRMD